MRRLFLALFIIIGVMGCATTWPEACKVDDGIRRCHCTVLKFTIDPHPDKPSPAGVVGLSCDGAKLPVEAFGQAVEK